MGLFDKIRNVIGSKIIKPSLPKFRPDILKKMDIRIPGRNMPKFDPALVKPMGPTLVGVKK